MSKQSYLYGKPNKYPYHFIAVKKGVARAKRKFNTFWSGSFKTKKACVKAANELNKRGDMSIRVFDRRKRGKKK